MRSKREGRISNWSRRTHVKWLMMGVEINYTLRTGRRKEDGRVELCHVALRNRRARTERRT